MALSDLAVYSEFAYAAMTEVLDQQVNLFNEASDGTIILRSTAHVGDYSEEAFFAKIADLIRRRNAYGSGPIATDALKHIRETSVKVAAGTKEIRLDPAQFRWIQRSPEEAGAALGQQLAGDALADMLNTGIGCGVSALIQASSNVNDATAVGTGEATFANLTKTAGKMGDRQTAIRAWIMHSTPLTGLYLNALTNAENLFKYETVNVVRDPFGRLFIVTDSPALQWSETTPTVDTGFYSLGLQQGAILVGQNNDFDYTTTDQTGYENIRRTYQAEWSYNVGIKGFAWDKANGGPSPTNAALFASPNWDRYSTSHKDLAGVVLKTK